jgi:tRNA pseudouridine65 synthase
MADSPQSSVAEGASAIGPLPVLYRDEQVVAVHKPSGLLVHRDEHHPEAPAALQTVRDQLGCYLYPFHRLDRATSGILLFGLSSAGAAAWQKALASPDAHKDYLALVRWPGSNRELGDQWLCDRPLSDEKDVPREARSEFALVERFRHAALVRCRIFTGRYHQIRRHANHSGRHVLGDTTHGKGRINAAFRERYALHRLFLHLNRIRLVHPATGEPWEIEDPLPAELTNVLASLRAEAASE